MLNDEDKRKKLLELKDILDEYAIKEQNIAADMSENLTLEGNIDMEIIKKLATLEMEVNDILNKDSKKKLLLSEKEKLTMELEKNIESTGDNKKVARAGGR